jgi:hypothetical protein
METPPKVTELHKLSKNDLKKIIVEYNLHTKITNYRNKTKKELLEEIHKRLIYVNGKFLINANKAEINLPYQNPTPNANKKRPAEELEIKEKDEPAPAKRRNVKEMNEEKTQKTEYEEPLFIESPKPEAKTEKRLYTKKAGLALLETHTNLLKNIEAKRKQKDEYIFNSLKSKMQQIEAKQNKKLTAKEKDELYLTFIKQNRKVKLFDKEILNMENEINKVNESIKKIK